MNSGEYKKVEKMTYREYCNYLKQKYGMPRKPYMSMNWVRTNSKCLPSRTNEGLFVHHVYEDTASLLSSIDRAKTHPYEWQMPENLVYCDYLEHLYLHVLISEYPAKEKSNNDFVGIAGVLGHLVPELNDFYSGYRASEKANWNNICFDKVKDDKDVYMDLLSRFSFIAEEDYYGFFPDLEFKKDLLCTTYPRHNWPNKNNSEIYEEIMSMV